MSVKWGEDVDGAIAEAVAAEMKSGDAYRKLRAGRLFDVNRPVAIPERTFRRYWRRAREAQREVLQAGKPCPSCGRRMPEEPTQIEEGSLLEDIARDIEERERREAAEDGHPASAELHPTMGGG